MAVQEVAIQTKPVLLGERPITADDVTAVAWGTRAAKLSSREDVQDLLMRGRSAITDRLARGESIYGVTTGYGDSVVQQIAADEIDGLSELLIRYHGCGVGAPLTDEQSLAVTFVRAATLTSGFSGVRPVIIERLLDLVAHRIAPVIPSQGSVGASGDLTPLSYVAAVIQGDREVRYRGETRPAADVLRECGIEPVSLGPKEGLALINGTAVMGALACFVLSQAEQLAAAACTVTAMVSDAIIGNPAHFDERIFGAKPHPGCVESGRLIREGLAGGQRPDPLPRLQDRYSVRCAPHVIGVLLDTLPWCRQVIDCEINGANDNPLVDPDSGEMLHGGNFYGGHVVAALDMLKTAMTNVAELLERQLLLLCQPSCSNGLPVNLSGAQGHSHTSHHGFKGVQITASALVAEMIGRSGPSSLLSRSTENHNQDKVSMGTIAARDCLALVDMANLVAAICLMAGAQGAELRGLETCGEASRYFVPVLREHVAFLEEDRRLDKDISMVAQMLTDQAYTGAALLPLAAV